MNQPSFRPLTLGTRPSALARWQSELIVSLLAAVIPGIQVQLKLMVTEGDRVLDKPLPEIGGKGVFTAELEAALASGGIDLVVHSLKDLPVETSPGLCIAAIPARGDARDVLIAEQPWTLDNLPYGARVGTSSNRRSVQLLAARPDLHLLPLRGNVDTRIRKALRGEYDAIVLAAAGVERLGLEKHITQYLPFERMLPAPGQGALAVQCREEDAGLRELLAAIDHAATRRAVEAERAFLSALGGGCSAPIAAYAVAQDAAIGMNGLVASLTDGEIVRVSGSGADPIALGQSLARQALAQRAGEQQR